MRPRSGFTLIEILVVLAIIGVLAAVVQFSFTGANVRQSLAATAEAAAQRIELARSHALQGNREWGLRVEDARYLFLEFDPQTAVWVTQMEKPLAPVDLPAGMRFELIVDGFDQKALREALRQTDAADDAGEIDDAEDFDDTADDKPVDEDAPQLLPDVLLLSSGETTPFTLRILPASEDTPWRIGSDGLQRVVARLDEDAP